MSMPDHVFHGHVISVALATGAVQRGSRLRTRPRSRLSAFRPHQTGQRRELVRCGRASWTMVGVDTRSSGTRNDRRGHILDRPGFDAKVRHRVGMFIALLDIQIVASSLHDIGGGLSAARTSKFGESERVIT